MRLLKNFLLVLLGFCLYPLLFVPLAALFAPGLLQRWILVFADYLKLWGL